MQFEIGPINFPSGPTEQMKPILSNSDCRYLSFRCFPSHGKPRHSKREHTAIILQLSRSGGKLGGLISIGAHFNRAEARFGDTRLGPAMRTLDLKWIGQIV